VPVGALPKDFSSLSLHFTPLIPSTSPLHITFISTKTMRFISFALATLALGAAMASAQAEVVPAPATAAMPAMADADAAPMADVPGAAAPAPADAAPAPTPAVMEPVKPSMKPKAAAAEPVAAVIVAAPAFPGPGKVSAGDLGGDILVLDVA